MSILRIQKTTNYGQFKTLKGNRNIYVPHFKNLAKSVQKKNLLQYYPILVNRDMVVIDGQHRLKVAKELGVPVYYIVAPEVEQTDVILLNGNSRNWRSQDYINYFCEQKIPDYLVLRDFMKRYGFTTTLAMSLLKLPDSGGGSDWVAFKEGGFQVEDLPLARERAEAILSIKPYCRDNAWLSKVMAHAVNKFMEQVPVEVLVKKLKETGIKITPATRYVHLLRQFEYVLNFKKRKEESFIRLF